ncbi:MAG: hypothetical protein HZB16_09815 [Armatimonadetes bacterium]|nr:hypothetical protein [Armatimonadota bacterium]
MKARGWWWLVAVALAAPGGAAWADATQLDRLSFSASFDDLFLYVAFTCQDVNLCGREERYGYPVSGDDAVELLFDITPGARSGADRQTLYRGCFKLGLSAAGGIFLGVGGGDARRPEWLPLRPAGRTGPALRTDLKLDGTLNDPTDVDGGWSVEAAIPWQRLGLEGPQLGEVWAYNVVRTLRGDAEARFSLAEGGDDLDPSRWLPMSFRQGPAGLEAGRAFLVFSQADGQNPTIDGNVTEAEWPVLQRVELTPSADRLTPLPRIAWPVPAVTQAPLPAGSTFIPRELAPPPVRGAWQGDGLVLATYQLDLGLDRRAALDANGASLLAAHPLGGLGPQNSAQRIGAHLPQVQRAGAAGIDALLVSWPCATAARDAWALDALRSLALAAAEVGQGSQSVPLLAPRVNVAELGAAVDLTQQAQAEQLYQALAEFYQQVPPQLRARLADGPRRELLVDLGAAPANVRFGESFQTYIEQRFREGFGVDVAWLGDALWARRGARLDAARTVDGGTAVFAGGAERVRLGVVRPGRDETRVGGALVPRHGFEAFRASFEAAAAGHAEWLLFDSWNDLRAGTQVIRTREWGTGYERRAGGLAAQFANPSEQQVSARVRQLDAPTRVAAGGRLLVSARLVNAGLAAWGASSNLRLAALWHAAEPKPLIGDDGKPLVDRATGRPVMTDVPISDRRAASGTLTAEPGGSTEAELPVEALDALGKPLAPGRYRLRFALLNGTRVEYQPVLDDKGQPVKDEKGRPKTTRVELPNVLGTQGDRGCDLPIDVVAPEQVPDQAATVLSADLPARVETGRLYPLTVTLRNDGRLPWPEGCRIGVRYEAIDRAAPNAAPTEPQPLTGWVPCGPITTTVSPQGRRGAEPGQTSTARIKLPTADANGKPLPADSMPGRVCRARLALLDRAGQALPSSAPWFQAVQVLARDWGAGIGTVDVPRLLQAGSSVSGAVTVQNTAFRTWALGHCELSWSWYRFDGAELKLDAGRAPVPVEVRSGQSAKVPVTIVAPAYTGPLLLAFDLVFDGTVFGSRQPSTYDNDVAVEPVVVVGGPYRPLSLAAQLNVVGTSLETGDMNGPGFDGQGRYLPAELVPPTADDLSDGLYPTGWLSLFDGTARYGTATFRYPAPVGADNKQAPSVLRPDGQVVTVVPGSYLRLHVLGASVRGEVTTRFGTVDAKGAVSQTAPVTVTNWDQSPRHGEAIGLRLPYRDTRLGADRRPAWLHHIVVPLEPGLTLARLVLPRTPDLRIMALTLEAAPTAAGPPAPTVQP